MKNKKEHFSEHRLIYDHGGGANPESGMIEKVVKSVLAEPGDQMRVWDYNSVAGPWNDERIAFGDKANIDVKAEATTIGTNAKKAANIAPQTIKGAVEVGTSPLAIAAYIFNKVKGALWSTPLNAVGSAVVLASRYLAEAPNIVPITLKKIREKIRDVVNKIPEFETGAAAPAH